ncbi:MAG: hypothetical protein ACQETL_18230 [Bacteroidota bacterium]
MKQILGDNQFFGINHYDLEKGDRTKQKFSTNQSIYEFIIEATDLGLDGFMLNSNRRGFDIINEYSFPENKEIHYSVPYPHKFATMVNEKGMLYLLKYALKQGTISSLSYKSPLFIFTRNVKYLISFITDLEIPKALPDGSYVYLQNIITDLVLGMERPDLLLEYCKVIKSKGYKPGLITLNPLLLEEVLTEFPIDLKKDLIICFNINKTGFNVFPSLKQVEMFINSEKFYKLMGMSILSSGGVDSITDSLEFVRDLDLDYVVYGSSKIEHIQSNFQALSDEIVPS